MTFAQFMAKALEAFPRAIVDEHDGELVIYTGLKRDQEEVTNLPLLVAEEEVPPTLKSGTFG